MQTVQRRFSYRCRQSRSSAYKLEEHSQQGHVKDGNNPGGSGGGSSKVKTDQNGVKVWPIASTWMRVEPRSRSSRQSKVRRCVGDTVLISDYTFTFTYGFALTATGRLGTWTRRRQNQNCT